MSKIKSIAIIIIGVALAYLIIIITMPILDTAANDSATIIENEHDLSKYTGAVEGLKITPWVLYFLPAVIGIVALVIVLRRPDSG